MTKRLVIAIDGPSGSGKSSTSKEVARRLGLAYLDTGAMYRAVAVAFLDSGGDASDTAAIIDATTGADIAIALDPDDFWVRVNGRDQGFFSHVTSKCETHKCEKLVVIFT